MKSAGIKSHGRTVQVSGTLQSRKTDFWTSGQDDPHAFNRCIRLPSPFANDTSQRNTGVFRKSTAVSITKPVTLWKRIWHVVKLNAALRVYENCAICSQVIKNNVLVVVQFLLFGFKTVWQAPAPS